MTVLKQNTVYTQTFLMVQSSDHITGLTGASPSVSLSKAGAAFAGAAGAVTEIANGWYKIALTAADTNTLGSLAYHITAASGDPTDFKDDVQAQIFPDLLLDASTGRVKILNNLQQNTAMNPFIFPMTSSTTGLRQTGLTVTAQRTLGSGGFSNCANAVSEIGTTGIYAINLNASDLNASTVALLLTATGANDLVVPVTPTP